MLTMLVEAENKYLWEWFISLMRDDLDMDNGTGQTIIGDRKKGMINVGGLSCFLKSIDFV